MNQQQNIQPPKLFLRFFRWFCDPAIAEDIEGDLTEMFRREAGSKNIRTARLQFSINVLKLFRPGIIKKFGRQSSYNSSPMFKNYFLTSVRSLMRSPGFSVINILGLAVGLAIFGLIAFYVYHEFSFDRYHKNADRIVRIVENLRTENELLLQSTSSPPMGPRLLRELPEVEKYVRFQNWNLLGQRNGNSFYESESYIADSTVFDVFSFKLIKGDKTTALREPYSIVLTETMAKRYFGDEDPVGQTLKMDYDNYKVTGVMEDVPENSHFRFSNLISFSTWSRNNKDAEDDCWFCNGFHTYILLNSADSKDAVREKMKSFIDKNVEKGGMYYEDLPTQDLTSIYMAPQRSWENGTRGNLNNMYILSIIAVFILLIACFNYVNLATARASRRLKEVAMRKSLGAGRKMLVAQFLGESLIVTIVSGLLAVLIGWLSLPWFRTLVESPLPFSVFPDPWIVVSIGVGLVLFIGILAGAYPALIISGFQPLQIFRPSAKGLYSHQNFRKVLVGIQFMISIMLVAGTLLVGDQIDLVKNQDLGFEKDALLFARTNGDTSIVSGHLEAFKNELKRVPGVVSVAGSSSVPGQNTNNIYTEIEMTDGKMSPTNINYIFVDHDFFSTYGIKFAAGRDFLRENKLDDTTAFIINETAMKDFGWNEDQAIGKQVWGVGRRGKIIGVVKDFNYKSLHEKVEPVMMALTNYVGRISIRVESGDLTSTVDRIQKKWNEMIPYLPFDYQFLDVMFDNQYKADQQLNKTAGVFTGLAIFIGCLGLLGLTSFAVERRTKEIGIRKVLGASVGSVMVLIVLEFIWLIAIAFVIATPITWYLIREWEQNFTLQAAINPLRFVMAMVAVMAFAWLTISFLSFRAATSNPTKALRTE
ncbi:MAG TPA: ABC transporter permease [Cyclobacteriaceae bacterium]|nr:ABC transporter permease [Cyclobacteriaceae bacterium]